MDRKDYINGTVSHSEYYGTIAREAGIAFKPDHELVQRARTALAAGDEYLNTIPLAVWDATAFSQRHAVAPILKQHGDDWSMSGGVCVAKEAVRRAATK